MSSSLEWRAINPPQHSLPNELKYTLRKKCGDPVRGILTSHDIPYLEGLADAGIKGARQLIELVQEHMEIEVFESY